MKLATASNKTILITGADGFTGLHLSNYLKEFGYKIVTLDKDVDIRDIDKIGSFLNSVKPNYIIHLAAISFVGADDKLEFYRTNVLGTQNILDSINFNIDKVILASSATVYGNQDSSILDESLTPNPVNHYGISKFAMEQIAKNYFNRFNIVVTRPFNYIGVGQSENFLIPKIVKHYSERRRAIELGNLDVIREFNDVSFVCEAYRRLIENSSVSGEILNIASGRGILLRDIIETMNKIAGYEIEVKVNPKFVRKNEIYKLIGSPDRLFRAVDKIPQPKFEDSLKKIYNYMRSNI